MERVAFFFLEKARYYCWGFCSTGHTMSFIETPSLLNEPLEHLEVLDSSALVPAIILYWFLMIALLLQSWRTKLITHSH